MAIAYSDVVNSSENVDLQDLVIIINKNIEKNNALIKKVFPSEEGYPLISRINRMEVEGNLLGSDAEVYYDGNKNVIVMSVIDRIFDNLPEEEKNTILEDINNHQEENNEEKSL